jgi:hypothetical protein
VSKSATPVLEKLSYVVNNLINILMYNLCNTCIFILCWKTLALNFFLFINIVLYFYFLKIKQFSFKVVSNIDIEMCSLLSDHSDHDDYLLLSNPLSLAV